MPMKTTFRMGQTALAWLSCSRISPAERCPRRPMVPVAQKVHPIRHPTLHALLLLAVAVLLLLLLVVVVVVKKVRDERRCVRGGG